jgi:endoplasmic reticulum Man9GlcNAc2 1,2-alpha-mannosidase
MVGGTFVHSSQNDHSQQSLDWRATSSSARSNLGGYGFSQSRNYNNQNTDSGISLGKMSSFFGGRKNKARELPVYKDKPYFKPRRTGRDPVVLRVVYMVVAAFAITFLYVFWGSWGGPPAVSGPIGNTGENLWKWVQSFDDEDEQEKKADWEDRRQKVKDVFTVSWDSYEKYGWGECRFMICVRVAATDSSVFFFFFFFFQVTTNTNRSPRRAGTWSKAAWAGPSSMLSTP